MTDDDDLVTWFTEQLDAEEAVARAAIGRSGHWSVWEPPAAWGEIRAPAVLDSGKPILREHEEHGIGVVRHIALWDPARVLAEVAAKRAILALHRQQGGVCLFCTYTISSESGRESAVDDAVPFCEDWPCDTVRLLAAPYADQLGYRPEWAVGS